MSKGKKKRWSSINTAPLKHWTNWHAKQKEHILANTGRHNSKSFIEVFLLYPSPMAEAARSSKCSQRLAATEPFKLMQFVTICQAHTVWTARTSSCPYNCAATETVTGRRMLAPPGRLKPITLVPALPAQHLLRAASGARAVRISAGLALRLAGDNSLWAEEARPPSRTPRCRFVRLFS